MMISKEKMLTVGTTALVTASTLVGSCFADDGVGTVISTGLTKSATDALAAFALILTPALSIFGFKFIAKQGFSFFKSTTK